MRRTFLVLLGLTLAALFATAAEAKKFRYASGPTAPEDTVLTMTGNYLDPVVRSRGPRVPYTNLQLAQIVADSAFAGSLGLAPLEPGSRVVVAPARDHPLNFVAEHALLKALSRRGVQVTVRRSIVPDDSVQTLFAAEGDPLLEYTVGSVRTTYLRLVGFLPGRVKVERQTMVEGALGLRDPNSSRMLWSNDVALGLLDRIPRNRLTFVEDQSFADLKSQAPARNVDKVFEPILVVAVVGGLVALFFQNRP